MSPIRRAIADNAKRLLQWLEQKPLWFDALFWVWSGFFVFCSSMGLLCYISGDLGAATGFWQVAIDLVGFPAVLYGIVRLLGRKPELEVGLVAGHPRFSTARDTVQLSGVIQTNPERGHFSIIIRNRGNLAARRAQVTIENTSFDMHNVPLRSHSFFSSDLTKDIVFPSPKTEPGYQLDIYANDAAVFRFSTNLGPRRRARLSFPVHIPLYLRIIADGLDSPVEARLEVILKRSSQEDGQ